MSTKLGAFALGFCSGLLLGFILGLIVALPPPEQQATPAAAVRMPAEPEGWWR